MFSFSEPRRFGLGVSTQKPRREKAPYQKNLQFSHQLLIEQDHTIQQYPSQYHYKKAGHACTISLPSSLSGRIPVRQEGRARLHNFASIVPVREDPCEIPPWNCQAPSTFDGSTKSRSKVIIWTDDCQTAFEAAKSSLASATLLNHPDPKSKTRLSTDASDSAIGAELSQKLHGMWRPIAFFSRKLTST
ncbi:transposon tf2-11 polyprotein [Plakobranchus ocellatus]|uniref:Transposon tf2-11 polyprotein n=1 Tax=Plakobranchus ocellatus TaxID=259542 RepID=A0AAV4D3P8_9GAST|nr:transposon tf2-11 polyprotein [Plakobranchus ocellatus]